MAQFPLQFTHTPSLTIIFSDKPHHRLVLLSWDILYYNVEDCIWRTSSVRHQHINTVIHHLQVLYASSCTCLFSHSYVYSFFSFSGSIRKSDCQSLSLPPSTPTPSRSLSLSPSSSFISFPFAGHIPLTTYVTHTGCFIFLP